MLYGVTGSGKTHTVFGDLGYRDPSSCAVHEHGIIYFCFERLMAEPDCSISLNYLEIYNEQVKDLLGTDDNLMVGENGQGDVVVQGLSSRAVESFDEMISHIKEGNCRRKMAKTCANAFSSRSHAILQIHLRKKKGNSIMVSKLSFIDLAGSERVELTQNRGIRLAEGSNINKSLLALGKVINKLSEKSSDGYVPYRDSKLTRLLKDSLGGNTKTVLITCISSNRQQVDEMIHSLNYAARAKKIKLVVEANTFEDVPPPAAEPEPPAIPPTTSEPRAAPISGYLEEIEELRGKILELESQLHRERGGRSNLESTYNNLISELQEQWELRNSIVELSELQRLNSEKLALKKKQLLTEESNDIKKKRQIVEEIKGLEELVADNEAIKQELEKRLRDLEEKRAALLGLKNRSVSPIILNRARKREEDEPLFARPHRHAEKTTEKKATKSKAVVAAEKLSSAKPPGLALQAPAPARPDEAVDDAYPQVLRQPSSSKRLRPLQLEKSAPKRLSAKTSDNLSVYDLILYDNDGPLLPPSHESSLNHVNKAIDFEEDGDARWPLKELSMSQLSRQPEPQRLQEMSKGSLGDFNQMKRDLQEVRGSSREMRIQQKLQKAREKMREFKKKISLMKVFLAKYETRAIEKCSLDIFKVVSALLQEQEKQNYLLTEEENQILREMAAFARKFSRLHAASLRSEALLEAKENIRLDPNQLADAAQDCQTDRSHLSTLKSAAQKQRCEVKDAYLTTSRLSKPEARLDSRTESILSRINRILN
jgi:hypothetical protein